MDWVYPDKNIPLEQLPEKTFLQKEIKKYLIKGEKIGWTLGKLKVPF
jgi:hypothetical protein